MNLHLEKDGEPIETRLTAVFCLFSPKEMKVKLVYLLF